MKLITDQIPEVQVVVTGSSSFELANKLNEPLTGRKWEYKMSPLSFGEMVAHHGLLEEKRLLAHLIVYGYYPDGVNNVGALWENFMVSERMKYSQYSQNWANSWYWRTKEQKEIDYIEEQDGVLTAFEFKWNPYAKRKIPKLFLETYTGSEFKIIHRDNLEDFLM